MVASVNKMFVMLAYFDQADKGKFTYDDKKTIENMIRVSDNNATNKLIKKIGEEEVNTIIHNYGFQNTTVKIIPASGRTTENVSTANNLSELLEGIHNNSYPNSKEMQRILGLDSAPGHKDRLIDSTCIPVNNNSLQTTGGYVSDILDKTGYIYGVNADAGIINSHFVNTATNTTTDVPYIAIVLIEDKQAKDA